MEFTIPAPLGAQASLLANTPARKPPDSSKIEAAPNAGKARADMHNSKNPSAASQARDKAAPTSSEVEIEPDTLAGPPPSFQVNILELDQKLQQKLARLETERARDQQDDRIGTASADDDNSTPSGMLTIPHP
ncbi:hypothetical protein SAMN05444851_2543 [Aliiroseovarius sediminilitoris]|uniref:Uncharacterized protein n=1 Tax=Aliiroseovarius sediminilitoris TaxID=1173584 RepID=A0A1I0QGB8_9RHOB|nr:hypothetical protein [Aliiroseovarius sediminilitoris]SEW26148.1 hypothetical protein SAMN05444851_2543 [Aliiroseovarius sediminilitoris]